MHDARHVQRKCGDQLSGTENGLSRFGAEEAKEFILRRPRLRRLFQPFEQACDIARRGERSNMAHMSPLGVDVNNTPLDIERVVTLGRDLVPFLIMPEDWTAIFGFDGHGFPHLVPGRQPIVYDRIRSTPARVENRIFAGVGNPLRQAIHQPGHEPRAHDDLLVEIPENTCECINQIDRHFRAFFIAHLLRRRPTGGLLRAVGILQDIDGRAPCALVATAVAELTGRDHRACHFWNIDKNLVPAPLHERLVFRIIPANVCQEISQSVITRAMSPDRIVDGMILGHQLGMRLHPTLRSHQVVVVEHDAYLPLAAIGGNRADRCYVPPDGLLIKATRLWILWKITYIMKSPLVVNAVGLIRFDARYQMVHLQLDCPVNNSLPCQNSIVTKIAQLAPRAIARLEQGRKKPPDRFFLFHFDFLKEMNRSNEDIRRLAIRIVYRRIGINDFVLRVVAEENRAIRTHGCPNVGGVTLARKLKDLHRLIPFDFPRFRAAQGGALNGHLDGTVNLPPKQIALAINQ